MNDIIELVETGLRGSNHYLRNGYRLLGFAESAKPAHLPPGQGSMPYVRRSPLYILGRPTDVAQVGPPNYEQFKKDADGA